MAVKHQHDVDSNDGGGRSSHRSIKEKRISLRFDDNIKLLSRSVMVDEENNPTRR